MFLLLILLNLCHWAADYTHLSTREMLAAKRFGSPLPPILLHAFVHAFLMGVMLFVLGFDNWNRLFVFQLITHFGIDVLKGKMNVWFPSVSNPANKFHWWVFGADQFLHQVVIITMAYLAQ